MIRLIVPGHVGQQAAPRGHPSVWMEDAKVPEAVLKAFRTETPVKQVK